MIFSFVFPFLLIMGICQGGLLVCGKPPRGWVATLMIASAAALIVILPVGGLPVGRWLISLYANPSIPLTAFLLTWVLKNAFQYNLLNKTAVRTCQGGALLAGMALYPMALGLGPFDPYGAGWHFSWLFISLFIATLLLLMLNNRFALVLLATILAYDCHLLESGNLWDYLVDPILVVVSVVGLGHWGWVQIRES